MEKETLSDKIQELAYDEEGIEDDIIRKNDVKDFIKKLKEEIQEQQKANGNESIFIDDVFREIDTLAGDKLMEKA